MADRRDASRSLEEQLDKIEDRLRDAPLGLHQVGDPASATALNDSLVPAEHQPVWARWDGLDLGQGETILYALASVPEATQRAAHAKSVGAGDVVVGEHGHDLLALPPDPYEEGADVLLVTEDGERQPYASSVPRLVLGALAEITVLYDREGEFQGELFEDDGELSVGVRRRLLRRRLDADPDAPLARLELGFILREAGELAGARSELKRVIKVAPEYSRARFEMGRTLYAAGQGDAAARSFERAAGCERDETLSAYFLAWAVVADERARDTRAAEVRGRWPGFAAAQAAAVRDALDHGQPDRAREHLRLGLAVAPTDVALLMLRASVDDASSNVEDGKV
ncbi:MAG: hypothetical protein B7733_11610 [Myxococcales bacterium FL481]|nr:MAG: hypothetical protein B7733_12205 [Myxococcales bacterium FL481]TPV95124.1 MAG: hypothetical protein B7733_11610 [Myxococcales bacterium FL481]